MNQRTPIHMLAASLVLAGAATAAVWSVGGSDEAPEPSASTVVSNASAPEAPAPALGDWLAEAEAHLAEAPLVIGPTAKVIEPTSGLALLARIDTGAAVTSLHCTPGDFVIDQPSEDPFENLGKPVRLRVENAVGDSAWIDTEVLDYVEVRSANGAEHRYRVRLPLKCGPVSKQTIVNLKDRSSMTYRLLIGRDFLTGSFVVDVSQPGARPL